MVTMTKEDAAAAWERAQEERTFWQTHQAEFLAQYPDKFVAVIGGEVVAVAGSLDEMVTCLEKSGLDPTQVWLRYFNTEKDATFF